ncbi:MAG TPA: glycosyltransferase family 4 protein [Acidiferrobacterales bacterium]
MKILYHHRTRSKDGQHVHIEELTAALKRAGHEIVMVGPPGVDAEQFGADAGWIAVLKKWLPKFVYELMELFYSVLDYRRLKRAAERHKPDCLYERYNLFLLSGVWLRRRTGLPMLLEVNAPLYDERKKYNGIALDRLARWAEGAAWRGADFVLPVTQVLAERVAQAGVDPGRIVAIPNGIDPERFSRVPALDDAKQALGLKGRLVLGFVGFMREWHGLERVVDLIADSGDRRRHLLLVGDGPARAGIERRAQERGIAERVTVTGVVERDRVARYIAAFDIALQPEVVPYASPLKLFEYLALGRAIVAPATPNLREVLTSEDNALLFDPADAHGFAVAVEHLCIDAELRAHIAAGARATIERRGLTWDNNAARVVELFRRLGVDAAVVGVTG